MSDLLEKFKSVELKPDTRITESDRRYCIAQQEAYEKGRAVLAQLAKLVAEAQAEQVRILKRNGEEVYTTYLGTTYEVSDDKILQRLDNTHSVFIHNIVSYFRDKYNVTLDEKPILDAFVREKPESRDEFLPRPRSQMTDEELDAYRARRAAYQAECDAVTHANRALVIRYEDILERIFAQLGGCSFADVALRELRDACRSAVWCRDKPQFEIKKSVISFPGYMCNFDTWHAQWHKDDDPEFSLPDSMKTILKGLNHFEIGTQDYTHYAIRPLFNYTIYGTDHEIGGQKVKSVKLFKKGRVDVRFKTEADARAFAEAYLGVA